MKRLIACLLVLALVAGVVPVAADEYPPSEYDCYMMPETPGCEVYQSPAEPTPEPSYDYGYTPMPTSDASEPFNDGTVTVVITDTNGVTQTVQVSVPVGPIPGTAEDPCGGYPLDWSQHGLQLWTYDSDGNVLSVYTKMIAKVCVDVETGKQTAAYTVCPGQCEAGMVSQQEAWSSAGVPMYASVLGIDLMKQCLLGLGQGLTEEQLQIATIMCSGFIYVTTMKAACAVSMSLLSILYAWKASVPANQAVLHAFIAKLIASVSVINAAACATMIAP